MRTYALQGGVRVADGLVPPRPPAPRPVPYFNELMTGFEYAAAVGMLYEGRTADGLKCIAAIPRPVRRAETLPVQRGRVRTITTPAPWPVGRGCWR